MQHFKDEIWFRAHDKKAFDRQILEIIGIGKSPVNFGLGEISTFSLRF